MTQHTSFFRQVKALFDTDAVQALLGHHTKTMAEHYGGVAFKKAAEVARKRAGGGASDPPGGQ